TKGGDGKEHQCDFYPSGNAQSCSFKSQEPISSRGNSALASVVSLLSSHLHNNTSSRPRPRGKRSTSVSLGNLLGWLRRRQATPENASVVFRDCSDRTAVELDELLADRQLQPETQLPLVVPIKLGVEQIARGARAGTGHPYLYFAIVRNSAGIDER